MTEAEWLVSENPERMLAFLRTDARNDRKLRLFACGCYRRLSACMAEEQTRSAIEVAERHADGLAAPGELRAARTDRGGPHNARFWLTRTAASAAARGGVWSPVDADTRSYDKAAGHFRFPNALAILRDVFGNPFRPLAFDPAWRTESAVALARQMYEEREFGAMPILADALQDTGCDDTVILTHCRGPGPHARGCWLVDAVLGKG